MACKGATVTLTNMEVDAGQLVTALTTVHQAMDTTLNEANGLFEECKEEFTDSKFGCLVRMISVYADCLKSLGVTTRKDMEAICQKHFQNSDVQEEFEELLQKEEMWSSFLETVDASILPDHPEMDCFIGDRGPVDVMADIEAAGGRVMVVTFGPREGALQWINDTGCSFQMVTDEERKLYKFFNLKRKFTVVWGISTLMHYASLVASGGQLLKPYKNIKDDPHQMGGDFMLDNSGNLLMIHASKTPSDRPSPDQILEVLK